MTDNRLTHWTPYAEETTLGYMSLEPHMVDGGMRWFLDTVWHLGALSLPPWGWCERDVWYAGDLR